MNKRCVFVCKYDLFLGNRYQTQNRRREVKGVVQNLKKKPEIQREVKGGKKRENVDSKNANMRNKLFHSNFVKR